MIALIFAGLLLAQGPAVDASLWNLADQNAVRSQQAIRFCRRYAWGWLAHADPRSGLIPRNLTADAYWNAKDSAADNYPFIVLTAFVTDDYHLKEASRTILETEQKLTRRLDSLPDDFVFATQSFRTEEPDFDDIIFGASSNSSMMPSTMHGTTLPPAKSHRLMSRSTAIFSRPPAASIGRPETRITRLGPSAWRIFISSTRISWSVIPSG
jgi:hypothetical protein